MRVLSASELIRVWEQGHDEPHYRRALLLLAAACPEQSPDELAKLVIGRRDARLLMLRELIFGPRLTCVTACPSCGERLEFNVKVTDIRMAAAEPADEELHLTLDDYLIDFSLPCTFDLEEVYSCPDRKSAREALLQRCIRSVRHQKNEITIERLPAHVREAVVRRIAEHDPQADTQLSLTCPGCDHRWQALFDIVSFFWSELEALAIRILREVHLLASAYGWREEDILAMSPLRRQLYLGMVGV